MKLKYQMEVIDIDGSPMAVPVGSDDDFRGVIHMNETTADILEVLKNDCNEDEIVQKLGEIYDATSDEIRKSVQKVLSVLRENNLLEE